MTTSRHLAQREGIYRCSSANNDSTTLLILGDPLSRCPCDHPAYYLTEDNPEVGQQLVYVTLQTSGVTWWTWTNHDPDPGRVFNTWWPHLDSITPSQVDSHLIIDTYEHYEDTWLVTIAPFEPQIDPLEPVHRLHPAGPLITAGYRLQR